MSTIDILKTLAVSLRIGEFRLVRFATWKLLQDFIDPSLSNNLLLEKSMKLSEEYGLPFWDATLLLGSGQYLWNQEIIDHADHHNKITDDFWIDPDQLFSLNEGNTDNLGINSLVRDSEGRLMHIPLMDFHLPVSEQGHEIVKRIVENMGMKSGYILNSGNSYHFIGDCLISENELMNFLSRGLLYGPLTDTRWIAHQILERSCTLRIGRKNGLMPLLLIHF